MKNGNYVVSLINSNDGRGAVFWGDGASGHSAGNVDNTNSLVGPLSGDQIGQVTPLTNGNYVVSSHRWKLFKGFVQLCDGTQPTIGDAGNASALTGSTDGDKVSFGRVVEEPNGASLKGILPLPNGNFVVNSQEWDSDKGAVTWCDGTILPFHRAGQTVSSGNSLTGASAGDIIGSSRLYALVDSNNYVIASGSWDSTKGAVTVLDGDSDTAAGLNPTSANSFTGSTAGDFVGRDGSALTNGKFVVFSGSPALNGAVTWCDSSGRQGQTLSTNNSFTGNNEFSIKEVVALANGNYVCIASNSDNYAALTLLDGSQETKNLSINSTNSFFGMSYFPRTLALPLSNGNYVFLGYDWVGRDISKYPVPGCLVWFDGTKVLANSGSVDPETNALVNCNGPSGQSVQSSLYELSNGNCLYNSTTLNFKDVGFEAGIVLWCDGKTPNPVGNVKNIKENILYGTVDNQNLGSGTNTSGSKITVLKNGNYIVPSGFSLTTKFLSLSSQNKALSGPVGEESKNTYVVTNQANTNSNLIYTFDYGKNAMLSLLPGTDPSIVFSTYDF
eukprot:COSAG01_NODE_6907_length_3444_cov_2.575187_3_plen_557_part_00